MNGPPLSVGLTLVALIASACVPRALQLPMPYTTRADADAETLPCAKTALVDLGFVFEEGPDAARALGRRVTRRGTRDRAQEVVRLELSGKDDRRVLELEIGINNGRGAPDPGTTPKSILSLTSPSRQTIAEVDAIMARCQGSPLS